MSTTTGRRQTQQSTGQSAKSVTTKAVTKVRQNAPAAVVTPEPAKNAGQEKVNSRSKSQAAEKRKRKLEPPAGDEPSPSGHRMAQLEVLWQQKFPQAPVSHQPGFWQNSQRLTGRCLAAA
nr:hypothetical protein BaRGS_025773 [Batillaria attramentaria]